MTWNINDPTSLPENIVREAIEKGHVHRTTFGGEHTLIHYDEERKELDIYKLHVYTTLGVWEVKNK